MTILCSIHPSVNYLDRFTIITKRKLTRLPGTVANPHTQISFFGTLGVRDAPANVPGTSVPKDIGPRMVPSQAPTLECARGKNSGLRFDGSSNGIVLPRRSLLPSESGGVNVLSSGRGEIRMPSIETTSKCCESGGTRNSFSDPRRRPASCASPTTTVSVEEIELTDPDFGNSLPLMVPMPWPPPKCDGNFTGPLSPPFMVPMPWPFPRNDGVPSLGLNDSG